MKVAVLGAGGFIGRALIQPQNGIDWIAVQRSEPNAQVRAIAEWRSCELLDSVQAEFALAGVDTLVYLVHSMAPRGIELQGSFEDIDALIALNVAEAARAQGVKKIIYLGGLEPNQGVPSRHLQSRMEVESILRTAGCPVITLRAGLVVGAEGSSLQMMVQLVERLPIMACPAWTASRTEAVALEDVLEAFRLSLHFPVRESVTYDLGSGEVLTYLELMKRTATALGRRRLFLPLPAFKPGLSVLWISLITGAKPDLVKPLVQSLLKDMIPRQAHRFPLGRAPVSFNEALQKSLKESRDQVRKASRSKAGRLPHWGYQTRIVSRLPYVESMDELAVGREYFRWLGQFLPGFIRVKPVTPDHFRIFLGPFTKAFLMLSRHPEQERPGLAVFEIEQGLLVRKNPHKSDPEPLQSFSFRRSREAQLSLGIIENYSPWLPRWTYRWTQAVAHAWVMHFFSKSLRKKDRGSSLVRPSAKI